MDASTCCTHHEAVLMALSGSSEWKIQTFGRWGSAAVLRYVKDALFGSNAEHLRVTKRACSLDELGRTVARKAPSPQHSEAMMRTISKKVMEGFFTTQARPQSEQ